jgi:hypothetical protein
MRNADRNYISKSWSPSKRHSAELDEFSSVRVCPGSPQRALSGQKENGTANHAEHAMGSGALQGQDDAFDLKANLKESSSQRAAPSARSQ